MFSDGTFSAMGRLWMGCVVKGCLVMGRLVMGRFVCESDIVPICGGHIF